MYLNPQNAILEEIIKKPKNVLKKTITKGLRVSDNSLAAIAMVKNETRAPVIQKSDWRKDLGSD
tara:strand:+ start:203 stop:394 length:192 start_codon:yes stop_codon:yes gene_type:complete